MTRDYVNWTLRIHPFVYSWILNAYLHILSRVICKRVKWPLFFFFPFFLSNSCFQVEMQNNHRFGLYDDSSEKKKEKKKRKYTLLFSKLSSRKKYERITLRLADGFAFTERSTTDLYEEQNSTIFFRKDPGSNISSFGQIQLSQKVRKKKRRRRRRRLFHTARRVW